MNDSRPDGEDRMLAVGALELGVSLNEEQRAALLLYLDLIYV